VEKERKMSKAVRYLDGTLIMPGTEAMELYQNPPKILKVPNAPKSLSKHMEDLDKAWRKAEGRKSVSELTERDKMLEGRIPWDPIRLKDLQLFMPAEKFDRIRANYQQVMKVLKDEGTEIADFNSPTWMVRAFVESGSMRFYSLDGETRTLCSEIRVASTGEIVSGDYGKARVDIDEILSTISTDTFFNKELQHEP
jgi:hypothetical protein